MYSCCREQLYTDNVVKHMHEKSTQN